MTEFDVIIEKGIDGYLISEVIRIQGCHTQAKKLAELKKRTMEAAVLCLKSTDISLKFMER